MPRLNKSLTFKKQWIETQIKRLYNIKEENNILKMQGKIILKKTKENLEYIYSVFSVIYLNTKF